MRTSAMTVCVVLVSAWAGAADVVDSVPFSTNWFDDHDNGLWLGYGFAGSNVYPTAEITGPEGDGVVGTMTAAAGGLGFSLGAVGWTAYGVRVQYVVQALSVPEGESLRTRIGLSADGGNQDDVTAEFLHHTPGILSANVRSRNSTFPEASQTWDDTGLTFAPGDWARLTLIVPELNSVKVSIEKWDGSAWSTPQTRVLNATDTTAAGGIVGRDFKRLTAGLLPSPGITTAVTAYVDLITVDDAFVEEEVPPANTKIVSDPTQGFIQAGNRLTLTAPTGSNYEWFKDDVSISEDPPRVTGAFERTLVFDPVQESDAGIYTVSYDDGSEKEIVVTDPFLLEVLPAGSLPVAGVAALALLALGLGAGAVRYVRRAK